MELPLRRAEIAVFWAMVAGVMAGVLGVLPAVLVLVPGLFWRPWFETGVRAWNGITRRVQHGLRRYVLRVTYYVVLTPMALVNPSIARPARWRALASTETGPQTLMAFARAPGHRWALLLVPIAALLSRTTTAQNSAPPLATYTLY